MSLIYKNCRKLQKLLLILVSGYLCTMPTDHRGLSKETPLEPSSDAHLLNATRCSFCDKTLLVSLPKFDKNFLDIKNNPEEVIIGSDFYKAALVKHTAENGQPSLLHPLCALKKKNGAPSTAKPESEVNTAPLAFDVRCTSYENFSFARKIFNLSRVTENSSLIFRYISKMLEESEKTYFYCLQKANPGIVSATEARLNIENSSFANKAFYLACVDLYLCSEHKLSKPLHVLNAMVSYLKTFPESDKDADEVLSRYWGLLASKIRTSQDMHIYINEIISCISTANQGKFTHLCLEMVLSYARLCSREEFSKFAVTSVLTGRSFIFNIDTRYALIHIKLPSFYSFLDTLDKHLSELESVEKIVLTESYLDLGPFIYKWYGDNAMLLNGGPLITLLERYFAIKKDEIENKRICPTSEGFFSAYKTVCIDKNIAMQSFVYDHIIKSLFERLDIKDMGITLMFLNCIAEEERVACSEQYFYGFMTVLLKELIISLDFRKEVYKSLEKSRNLDGVILIARHLSFGKNMVEPLHFFENETKRKIVEKFTEKDYALRYLAIEWLRISVLMYGNDESRTWFEEKERKLRDICDLNAAATEADLDLRRNAGPDNIFGLMPSEIKSSGRPERCSKEFVYAWCDKINFFGNALDYLRAPGRYPFVTKHLDLLLQYCLEHDKSNEFIEVKAMMVCILSKHADVYKPDYRVFLKALMESEHSFVFTNAVFQHLSTEHEKSFFITVLLDVLGYSVQYNKIAEEDWEDLKVSVTKHLVHLENNSVSSPCDLNALNNAVLKEHLEYLKSMDKPELNMIFQELLDEKAIDFYKIEKILNYDPPFIIPRHINAKPNKANYGEGMDCS
ncbi:hypothetical protein ENBRE01_2471 [Enteropsectra breve]|nr:hypothetical protein ENBRE01_2471 [Enteropsectra breve]